MVTASELPLDQNASAMEMAETIFGDGVTVQSASYTGSGYSSAIYTDGDAISPGVTPADTGVILTTGNLRHFTQRSGDPNRSSSTSTNTGGEDNNADFNALAGTNTYDATYLDIDIIPDEDVNEISLQFVFASEEYPEYAGSIYNDVVGVWVDGVEAEMVIGDGTTSPSNINDANNQNLYVSNTGDDYNTEMDGFTVTMTLKITVTPETVNSIRIGIADVGDSSYDSALIIAADSGQSTVTANDDLVTMAPSATKTVDVLANDSEDNGATIYVTHVNGAEVSAGDTITLSTGQQVTVNGDGTFTIVADSDTETVNFSYTIASTDGGSDTGFVTIESIPCFVAGTGIATPSGLVMVETLTPGDRVMTHDNGAQPLRWIGQRTVPATGNFAPIRILADTFGPHGELLLSPQHRVLIRDALAELLFGETEVLVSAKDLVNDHSVRPVEGGEVTYVHLLFDRHEVIYSEGLATESYLPGPQTRASFEDEIVDEICALFPEIDPHTGLGYSGAARRMLKTYEVRALFGQRAAA